MRRYFNFTVFFILALFFNCRSVTTTAESIPPKIFVYHIPDGSNGPVLIGHSDPTVAINSRGCPSGSFNDLPNSYILDMSGQMNFNVTCTDKGGVRKAIINLTPLSISEVSNIAFPNGGTTTPIITQSSTNTVTIEANFANLLTGQITTFSVNTDAETLTITAEANDFNNNKAEVKGPDGTNLPALVTDNALCERDLLNK